MIKFNNPLVFDFESLDTCKHKWLFTLKEKDADLIIENVAIIEREKPKGCFGHPKTISAIVAGRDVKSINTNLLDECACIHEYSCGQILSKCICTIKKMS